MRLRNFKVAESAFLIVALWCMNLPGFNFPTFDKILLAQSPQSRADLLRGKQKRLLEYDEDFLDFAKSSSDREWRIAMELDTAAGRGSDQLDAAITLLEIYDSLSCKEDRARVKAYLQKELPLYGRFLEIDIKQVNFDISSTGKPGVAAEAARMRDDLREAVGILKSVKIP